MQLSPVKVTYALCCLVCGRHGDKPIAASTGALGIGHHLGTDNLKRTIPTSQNPILKEKGLKSWRQWPRICGLTLPYLLKSVFRSVALVVEDRPLTHRFLLVAAALPAATCRTKTMSKPELKEQHNLDAL